MYFIEIIQNYKYENGFYWNQQRCDHKEVQRHALDARFDWKYDMWVVGMVYTWFVA